MTELFVLPERNTNTVPSKFNAIQQQLADGTYSIDLETLADAILDIIQMDVDEFMPPESPSVPGLARSLPMHVIVPSRGR